MNQMDDTHMTRWEALSLVAIVIGFVIWLGWLIYLVGADEDWINVKTPLDSPHHWMLA